MLCDGQSLANQGRCARRRPVPAEWGLVIGGIVVAAIAALGCGGGARAEPGGTDGALPDSGTGADGAPALAPVPPAQVRLDLSEGLGQVLNAGGAGRTVRAVWEHTYGVPDDPTEGAAEISARIQRMRAAGVNVVMFWVVSQYVDAVRDPVGHGTGVPGASWDMLAHYVDAVQAAGMEAHLWFSPMIAKDTTRANELVEHPEWQMRSTAGQSFPWVDLASDDARAYEIGALRFMAGHYHPDAIQLEEPFYHDTTPGQPFLPADPGFASMFMARFGYPVTTGRGSRPADVAVIKRQVIEQFGREARQAVREADARVALHVNVATWYPGYTPLRDTGLDLPRWQQLGILDGFEPQLYYSSTSQFNGALAGFQDSLGGNSTIIAGLATRFGDTVSPVFFSQLARAEDGAGAAPPVAGSAVFAYLYFDDVDDGLDARPVAPLQATLGASDAVEPSDSDLVVRARRPPGARLRRCRRPGQAARRLPARRVWPAVVRHLGPDGRWQRRRPPDAGVARPPERHPRLCVGSTGTRALAAWRSRSRTEPATRRCRRTRSISTTASGIM